MAFKRYLGSNGEGTIDAPFSQEEVSAYMTPERIRQYCTMLATHRSAVTALMNTHDEFVSYVAQAEGISEGDAYDIIVPGVIGVETQRYIEREARRFSDLADFANTALPPLYVIADLPGMTDADLYNIIYALTGLSQKDLELMTPRIGGKIGIVVELSVGALVAIIIVSYVAGVISGELGLAETLGIYKSEYSSKISELRSANEALMSAVGWYKAKYEGAVSELVAGGVITQKEGQARIAESNTVYAGASEAYERAKKTIDSMETAAGGILGALEKVAGFAVAAGAIFLGIKAVSLLRRG